MMWEPFAVGALAYLVLTTRPTRPSLALPKGAEQMDAQDWLTHHRADRFIPDRRSGFAVLEMLEPGDVLDDGSIICANGLIITGGDRDGVLLVAEKRKAAEYYGWFYDPRLPVSHSPSGERLYPMQRRHP